MPAKASVLKFASSEPIELAILLGVGALAIWFVLRSVRSAAGAAVDTATAAVNGVVGAGVGIATGNNVVTAGTPYEGTGIFGTLGAATNDVLGGAPQSFGEYLGGKFADWFQSTDDASSSSNQGASNNPYGATSTSYQGADDSAPKQATFVASPGATGGW